MQIKNSSNLLMNKQIQLLFLFLSILSIETSYAQASKLDSLEKLLKSHKTDDTIKVNLLSEIASLIYKNDTTKAKNYTIKAGELSDKIHFLKGKAESLWVMGTILSYYNSNRLALDYYLKALKISEEIEFKPGIVKYLLASGKNYATIGNIQAAIECFEKAKKIAEELNDKLSIGISKLRLCVIYTGQGDYKKATEEYQKLIPLCEKIKRRMNQLIT